MYSHIREAFSGAHETPPFYNDIGNIEQMSAVLLGRSHCWTDEEKGHDIREWQNALAESSLHEHAKPEFYLAAMEELELRAAGYPLIQLKPPRSKSRVIKSKGPGDL